MSMLDRMRDLSKKATIKAFKEREEANMINLEAVKDGLENSRVDSDEEPDVDDKKTIQQRIDDIDAQIKDIFKCLINIQKTHMAITRKQCELMGKMLELLENNPMLNMQNSK